MGCRLYVGVCCSKCGDDLDIEAIHFNDNGDGAAMCHICALMDRGVMCSMIHADTGAVYVYGADVQ